MPPRADATHALNHISKSMMNELLLVVSVLGSNVSNPETGQTSFIPVADCLNWLQDLQRALRTDNDDVRTLSNHLSSWKVLPQKLLPISLSKRDDPDTVLTVCKLCVILTKPMTVTGKRAGMLNIDTKSGKINASTIEEQMALRENALVQARALASYKLDFLEPGVLSVFVGMLEQPLRKGSEKDDQTIELVLHLLRNLLNPSILAPTAKTITEAARTHHELLKAFESELVLDILLFIGSNIQSKRMSHWNLLVMEILNFMIKDVDPVRCAEAHSDDPGAKKSKTGGLLSQVRQKEKTKLAPHSTASRHSRFGGTLRGKNAAPPPSSSKNEKHRRKNKQTATFTATSQPVHVDGESAFKVLHDFSKAFLERCYGPVMKSLKDEFRRDSGRLEASDKPAFFKIVTWFSTFQRSLTGTVGKCIFTLDLFSFNLVTSSVDQYIQEKKATPLSDAVKLYKEMTAHLFLLASSKEETENLISQGLMQKIFYENEPRDKVLKLVHNWRAGVFSKAYLDDLVGLTHNTLKVLDYCKRLYEPEVDAWESNMKKVKMTVTDRHKEAAARYSLDWYIGKIVSAGAIKVYTHLLRVYKDNCADANHHLVSFFTRLCKYKLDAAVVDLEAEEGSVPKDEPDKVTLEPLLFNAELMVIYDRILSDPMSSSNDSFKPLTKLVTTLVRHFAVAADRNPLLYVEGLFCVGNRFRKYCEMVTNVYLDENALTGKSRAEEEDEDDEARFREHQAQKKKRAGDDSSDDEDEWSDEEVVKEPKSDEKSDEEDLGEVGSDSDDDDEGKAKAKAKAVKMEARAQKAREKAQTEKAKKKRITWSTSEDQILKSAFFVHTSAKQVIRAVMTDPKLVKGGKGKKQIRERIKKLELAIMGGTEEQSSQEMEIDTQEPCQLDTQEPSHSQTSEAADKWNDSRKYVPKSKKRVEEEESEVTAGRLKKKAKAAVEDDDDEDLDFGGEVDADGGFTLSQESAAPPASVVGAAKNVFLDDDDE